jgi:hypothetical protein
VAQHPYRTDTYGGNEPFFQLSAIFIDHEMNILAEMTNEQTLARILWSSNGIISIYENAPKSCE